jgi:hypothetical protein
LLFIDPFRLPQAPAKSSTATTTTLLARSWRPKLGHHRKRHSRNFGCCGPDLATTLPVTTKSSTAAVATWATTVMTLAVAERWRRRQQDHGRSFWRCCGRVCWAFSGRAVGEGAQRRGVEE